MNLDSFFSHKTFYVDPCGQLWEEVSLWREFISIFSDKIRWRHVVVCNDKYASYGPHNTITWEDNIFEATMFFTYSEAEAVAAKDKSKVITIRPTQD